MNLFAQTRLLLRGITALIVAFILAPGGIVFAKPIPGNHTGHGVQMSCAASDCSNVDVSCMSHCITAVQEHRGVHANAPHAPFVLNIPSAPIRPIAITSDARLPRPGPEYHHSIHKSLLSVMKRE